MTFPPPEAGQYALTEDHILGILSDMDLVVSLRPEQQYQCSLL